MVLDSALADAKIRCDILAGVASEDQLHDLALSRSETRDGIRRTPLRGEQLAQNLLLLDQPIVLTKQNFFSSEGLPQTNIH